MKDSNMHKKSIHVCQKGEKIINFGWQIWFSKILFCRYLQKSDLNSGSAVQMTVSLTKDLWLYSNKMMNTNTCDSVM